VLASIWLHANGRALAVVLCHSAKLVLDKPNPRELYSQLPPVHLLPVVDRIPVQSHVYQCPVYKTVARQGQLSTTGHSTNFILMLELPTDDPGAVVNGVADNVRWIKAGVAAFCGLKH
jgi:dynein heavy chain, axonemal